jgi:hypothetical protein
MCIFETFVSNIHHRWLCITPALNLVPLVYYWKYREKTGVFTFICFFLFCLMITTFLFWFSPIRNGFMHKIDKTVVHVVAFLTIGYMLFFRLFFETTTSRYMWFIYGIFLTLNGYFLYLSKYYSNIQWCSREHIYAHFWFHLVAKPSIWFIFW